jgi:hypothetical protein
MRGSACKVIADIWRVVREWRVCFENFGILDADIHKIASACRPLNEVSTPALRRQLAVRPSTLGAAQNTSEKTTKKPPALGNNLQEQGGAEKT